MQMSICTLESYFINELHGIRYHTAQLDIYSGTILFHFKKAPTPREQEKNQKSVSRCSILKNQKHAQRDSNTSPKRSCKNQDWRS